VLVSTRAQGETDGACFGNDLRETRNALVNNYGWFDMPGKDNVYCYDRDKSAGDFTGCDGPAGDTGRNYVQEAFENIGDKITANDFFFFMVITHGQKKYDGSGIRDDSHRIGFSFSIGPIDPKGVDEFPGGSFITDYVNHLRVNPARSVWLMHCCFSDGYPNAILGGVPGRIIISGTDGINAETWTEVWGEDHWAYFKSG
jgi:hypothetical protein